jgi:hypothetical protein
MRVAEDEAPSKSTRNYAKKGQRERSKKALSLSTRDNIFLRTQEKRVIKIEILQILFAAFLTASHYPLA